MKFFSLDGKLYRALERVWQVMEVSLLFLVGALPILTIVTSAVAALRVQFDLIEKRETPVASRFWSVYKRTLKTSIEAWLIILAGFAALFGVYWGGSKLTYGSQYALIPVVCVSAMWMLIGINVSSLLAFSEEWDMRVGALFKQSVALGFGHVLQSALMVILLLAPIAVVVFVPGLLPIAILLFPGLVFYVRAQLARWEYRQ